MKNQVVCKTCEELVDEKRTVKGYFLMEIVLWGATLLSFCVLLWPITFILGLVSICYSVNRVIAPADRSCSVCGGTDLCPKDSAAGKRLLSLKKKF